MVLVKEVRVSITKPSERDEASLHTSLGYDRANASMHTLLSSILKI